MEKKNYLRPDMTVVKLASQPHLTSGSDGNEGGEGNDSRSLRSSDWSDE